VELVDIPIDRLYKTLQIAKCCGQVRIGFTALPQQSRELTFGIGIRDVGRIKAETMRGVKFENLANTPPEHGADQDIGIENKHY
jgi:hypothetical protein